jgi:hypothetical protein
LADLNLKQQSAYDTLISGGIGKDDAFNLVTGNLSAEDFKLKNSEGVKTNLKEQLDVEGFDYDLMKKTSEKIKKEIDPNQAPELMGVDETLSYAMPSTTDLFNLYGIRTDKEAPASVRGKLSFGLNDPNSQIFNAKFLLGQNLIEEGMKPELVEKYKDKIDVQIKEVGKGQEKTSGMIFKLPKELGGDGKYYKFNTPTMLPNAGDLAAISGDSIPIAMSIAGGTFGSIAGPAGTVLGSGFSGGLGEYGRLWMGRKLFGLNSYMSDEEFDKAAVDDAMLYGAIDAGATAVFLPLAAIVKQAIFTTPKERLSVDTMKKFIKAGGAIDKEMAKNLDEARKVLIANGLTEKQADDYLAISVAKAIPEAGILEKGSLADKLYFKQIKSAETKANIKEVETKLLKSLTGLNKVDDKAADVLIEGVEQDVRNIRNLELESVNKEAGEAFNIIQKSKDNIFKSGTESYVDDFGIEFAGVTGKLQTRLGNLKNQIDASLRNSKVQLTPDFGEEVKILNGLIKNYTIKTKPVPNLTKEQISKLSAEQLEQRAKNQNYNNMINMLDADGGFTATKNKLVTLSKGLKSVEEMPLSEAVKLRSMVITALDNADIGKGYGQSLRKLKGGLQKIIDDATVGNPKLAEKITQYDELLAAKQNSYFKDFATNFGYGPGKKVVENVKFKGGDIFNRFVNGADALENSARLGQLIRTKGLFNSSEITRMKSALYENYFSKVQPKEIGTKGVMSHKEFIEQYGKNYRLILGEKEYKSFVKGTEGVMKSYDNIIQQTADIQTTLSRALPGLEVNILDSGAPSRIVEHIINSGKMKNISLLLKKLPDNLITDIRRIYLNQFIKGTTSDLGNGITAMNGKRLNEFLTKNRSIIKQLFNDDFFNAHRSMANALEVIQTRETLGAVGAPGLTDAANKAGLFVDIFAGPLNHKRLIINRLGRIYDGFDLGGDSLALLRDYNKFVEAAKKNFIAGNYPKFFDNLSPSKFDNIVNKINIGLNRELGVRNRYSFKTNPLYAREYMNEKAGNIFNDTQQDDEPQLFDPIDKTATTLGDVASKVGKKYIMPIINRLTKGIKDSKKRRKSDDIERKIFEEEKRP